MELDEAAALFEEPLRGRKRGFERMLLLGGAAGKQQRLFAERRRRRCCEDGREAVLSRCMQERIRVLPDFRELLQQDFERFRFLADAFS